MITTLQQAIQRDQCWGLKCDRRVICGEASRETLGAMPASSLNGLYRYFGVVAMQFYL